MENEKKSNHMSAWELRIWATLLIVCSTLHGRSLDRMVDVVRDAIDLSYLRGKNDGIEQSHYRELPPTDYLFKEKKVRPS